MNVAYHGTKPLSRGTRFLTFLGIRQLYLEVTKHRKCQTISMFVFFGCCFKLLLLLQTTSRNYKHVRLAVDTDVHEDTNINEAILLFNQVPLFHSEVLVFLLQHLQERNKFKHVRLWGGFNQHGPDRYLNTSRQEHIIETMKKHVQESAVPMSFDRYLYFTNFSSFGTPNPTYINLIRDPVDKMVGRFYYANQTQRIVDGLFDECVESNNVECQLHSGQTYDLTIPYFCGHEDWCRELNNDIALQQAKRNVEKYYKVVGVLEYLNETLALLENKVPQYFGGVQNLYFNELLEPYRNIKPREIHATTRLQVQYTLKLEYDFYYFITSRLINQHKFIGRDEVPTM